MCEICNISNMVRVNLFSPDEAIDYVNKVRRGIVLVESMDVGLYEKTAKALFSAAEKGYGVTLEKAKEKEEKSWLRNVRHNVYTFSAAKQYQVIIQLQSVFGDKELTDELINEGLTVFNLYYVDYLSAELDSAEYQGKGARNFQLLSK